MKLSKTALIISAITTILFTLVSCKPQSFEIIECYEDNRHEIEFINPEEIYELPLKSFVGTVLEETTKYMVVAPNADEEEHSMQKVTIEYPTDHIDYLYGIGRKVVITYSAAAMSGNAVPTIKTDDIRWDGFEEFTLSVQLRQDSIPSRFAEIQYAGLVTMVANNREFDENASDCNLYYYGLHDVYVTVDGATLPLKEALTYGKVTLDGIIAQCNRLNALSGYSIETSYDDGGSSLYDFGDYKIIKYHTLDGNRDIYIGTSDMDINAKNAASVCVGAYMWKDWGVRLDAKDITSEGATVIFKQKGGNVTGSLQTGEAFWLEKLDGNKWVAVDTLPAIDYAFHDVAYMINNDSETELETTWKWLYGNLAKGQYRIAKEVMDFRGTGDFNEQIYYAYFDIEDISDAVFADKINAQMPKNSNYMFSPLSLKMAMALAANGAEGVTKDEILTALNIKDLDEFNSYCKKFIEMYSQSGNLSLNIANSIWLNESNCPYNFNNKFKETVGENYFANAQTVKNSTAVDKINSWVNDKTNGKIPSIISNSDFWASLVNAIYFKAAWQDDFFEGSTKLDVFTSADGKESKIDFMNKTDYISYSKTDNAEMICLPYMNYFENYDNDGNYLGSEYYENLNACMYFITADDDTNIAQELENASFSNRYVSLSLPKFEINYNVKMNDILKNIGIKTAFDKYNADFSNMIDIKNTDGLWIDSVLHKTYISVDEKGTEAAAVTAVLFDGATSQRPPQPIEVKFNKPFYFIIRANGETVFMGRYSYAQ